MICPAEVRKNLLNKWERGFFFKKYRECFPYEERLTRVTSRMITDDFEKVRRWILQFQDQKNLGPYLRWEEVNHRLYGRNRVPRALFFETPESLAEFLKRKSEWDQFTGAIACMKEQHESFEGWGHRYPLRLLEISEDLERVIRLWEWMKDHPRPDIYLRQIDLPGIDTKFTEKHKKILYEWLDLTLPKDMIDQEKTGTKQFENRFGYRSKPELIRFRFLDEELSWYGCDDISIPAEQFCDLYQGGENIPVKTVFVIENDISALSFPAVKHAMVIFGRGYHFDHLRDCEWLQSVDLRYWGDIDTHGFCILDQFRAIFPHTTSFLMDRETLMAHMSSWGEEAKPAVMNLFHLTDDEAVLYDELRFNKIRNQLRLEQEFIRFNRVQEIIRR